MIRQPFLKCNSSSCGRLRGGAAAILMLLLCLAVKAGAADMTGTVADQTNSDIRAASSPDRADLLDGVSFPTFYKTGLDACTSDDGKPVILLFSSSSCSHCEWVGEIFDFIVMYYMASGLIEAHHYDGPTGDDLLTEEIETEIPPEHLQIKAFGDPNGLIPYFNFNCQFERVGNGYEDADDSVAEAAEMRQIIETLVRVQSDGN